MLNQKSAVISLWILNRNFQKGFGGKGKTMYGEHFIMLELGLGSCFQNWVLVFEKGSLIMPFQDPLLKVMTENLAI